MAEKFKDWHLYIGCECLVNGHRGVLTGVLLTKQEPLIWTTVDEPEPFQIGAQLFSLILRQRESMTDEDQVEYKKLFHVRPYDWAPVDDYQEQYVNEAIGGPAEWVWLLKKGYDLFGLIDSGQAVDAETIK